MRSPRLNQDRSESAVRIYLADNSLYTPNLSAPDKQEIVVTGKLPWASDDARVTEIIRDSESPYQLGFLTWENGNATISPRIVRDQQVFELDDSVAGSSRLVSLPGGIVDCGEPDALRAEIASTLAQFVDLTPEALTIVVSVVLASWFPDCFEAIPYLWIVGALNSGKTRLLKLLWCFCRRGLLVGDLTTASVYELTDVWEPTLLIDELEIGRSTAEADLLRLLRTGSVPGVPTIRNGQPFSTYGMKIIASRQTPDDAALLSRGLTIPMFSTRKVLLPLDDTVMRRLAKKFQAKLLMFRLLYRSAVQNFCLPQQISSDLSGRLRQICHALAAPLLGNPRSTATLLGVIRDEEARAQAARFLEPEWLVALGLFEACHPTNLLLSSAIMVGGLAGIINHRLKLQGEDISLGAKKVGLILKSLGVRTEYLGREGRGLRLTSALKRTIHEIARRLGIDRRAITTLSALDGGYGGAPCRFCEEFGLTAGLRSVRLQSNPLILRTRRPLFAKRDKG